MAETIISRSDAMAQGLNRYFTGDPCPHGHVCDRYVSSFRCVECGRLQAARWRADNPEEARRKWMEYRARNPDKCREALRKSSDKHREKRNEADRLRRSQPSAYRDEYRRRRKDARRVPESLNKNLLRLTDPYYSEEAKAMRRREAQRLWYESHKDQVRDYQRRYYHEKPNKRASVHKRRVAKMGLGSASITPQALVEIFTSQKRRCAMCRINLTRSERHLDHIVPLSRGGDHDRRNVQFLCRPCNLSKHAKDPLTFSRERGLLL